MKRTLKYKKGGETPRKPIVVNDPNDPRLKAYNDSNTLYNFYKLQKSLETSADFKPADIWEVLRTGQSIDLTTEGKAKARVITKAAKKILKDNPTWTAELIGQPKPPQYMYDEQGSYDILHPTIKPKGTWKGTALNNDYSNVQPVQPYVYKKPANNKPKLNTYDDYLNAVKKLGANPRGSQGMSEAYALVNEMTKKFPYQETYLENGYNIPKRPVVYQKPVANNPQPKTVNKPVAKPVTVLKKDYWNTDKDVLAFRKKFVEKFGEEPIRDPNIAKYDYDKAYKAGVRPVLDSTDGLYHWDSEFKHDDHPNLIVNGVNTKTGKPVEQPKKVEQPVKPTYTSKKQLFQGSDFTLQTGLKPGLYHPEEIEEIKMKNKNKTVRQIIPTYKKGGLVKHSLGEVVKQGLSFEDPAVTSAGMNLAASAIDLGLDYLPNNTTTDADGNVIGSVDSRGVAIGRGALKGAAAGAALGPIGMGVGAAIGGVSSLISRNKEAEELKKAQTLSNRNIFTKRIFGKANSSNGLMTGTNTELYPHGGTITNDDPNANAELELNEQFQLPNGVVGEVDGPSHDNGGIEVALPEGTRVYSDRLKMGNKTFAQLTKPINNKIAKLDKKPDSKAKENTLALFNKQLDELFTIQESMKTEEQVKKFAKGGIVKYEEGGLKQGLIVGTGMINSWKQQRNLDKVPRPAQISPVNLTAGASPDMVDFSAERAAIDSDIAASNKGIELGSGSYSTQAANKQKMRSLQLAKRGESFQKQNNLNTQTNNAFKAAQAAAANQSAQINVGLDQYNLENQMNYNMWKTGNKNAISAANTRLITDMLNNSIMYDNQMAQAKVLAGKYAPEVAKDAQFPSEAEKTTSNKSKKSLKRNTSFTPIKGTPSAPSNFGQVTSPFKRPKVRNNSEYLMFGDLEEQKYGGTIKRSLKKTRK